MGKSAQAAHSGNSNGGGSLKVLRILRLLRPLRAITHLPSLKVVVISFMHSAPAVMQTVTLYVLWGWGGLVSANHSPAHYADRP